MPATRWPNQGPSGRPAIQPALVEDRRFTRNRPGVLISRITNDVDALDQLISSGVVTLFSSTLTLVGVVVIMLVADVQLALVVFLTLPVLAIASLVFRIVAASAYRITRERIAEVTAYLQESLSGVRVVRSFAQERRHVGRQDLGGRALVVNEARPKPEFAGAGGGGDRGGRGGDRGGRGGGGGSRRSEPRW